MVLLRTITAITKTFPDTFNIPNTAKTTEKIIVSISSGAMPSYFELCDNHPNTAYKPDVFCDSAVSSLAVL